MKSHEFGDILFNYTDNLCLREKFTFSRNALEEVIWSAE